MGRSCEGASPEGVGLFLSFQRPDGPAEGFAFEFSRLFPGRRLRRQVSHGASTVQLRGGTAEEAMHARALASTYIAAVDGMFVSVRERFLGLKRIIKYGLI